MNDVLIYQAQVMRALANPRRLAILHALESGPREVGKLASLLAINQPSCSQHLAAMAAVGIVEAMRDETDGRIVRYRLTDPAVMTACNIMHGVMTRQLERLSEAVISEPSLSETAASAASETGDSSS